MEKKKTSKTKKNEPKVLTGKEALAEVLKRAKEQKTLINK